VAVLVGYQAYRQYIYKPGLLTNESLSSLIRLADDQNAGGSAKIREQVEAAMAAGDVAQVGRILRF
jgi:hypothetical protein